MGDVMKWFWKKVALFAYRRWATPNAQKPVGVPGNRDPEHPCTAYEPRKPQLADWRDCNTDGHYMCRECCHRNPDGPPQERKWIQVSSLAVSEGQASATPAPEAPEAKKEGA